MIKGSNYWPSWQNNRINYILKLYGKEFFEGKKILELGSFNGYIGAYFQSLGADVHCVDGREENVINIKTDYPQLTASCKDLDSPNWDFDRYDIIINFGLYYHLEKFHKEHLINCINNCNLMFFETVIYDSTDNEIYFRDEIGNDQSLSMIGGTPSTSFIETIFEEKNVVYEKITNTELNDGTHKYDWIDVNSKELDGFARRFWIVTTTK
jgi:2-polyprenyl-3-methyl-5-hydroxy-6-metoxy-1,4-benzoquinol methylase